MAAAAAIVLLAAGLPLLAQNSDPKQESTPQQARPQGNANPQPKAEGSAPNSSAPPSAPAAPSAAQKFPYPGEDESSGSPSGDPAQKPEAAQPPAAAGAPKSFPYPGDPAANESSSSSASSSSSTSGEADVPPETPQRRRLPREFHPQSPEDRVTEDLEVARFYRDKGDLRAAHLRAQDAVKTLPNDPEGHFLLGQIAQEMKDRDEAKAEFNAYLRLEPEGDHVKEARRRLASIH